MIHSRLFIAALAGMAFYACSQGPVEESVESSSEVQVLRTEMTSETGGERYVATLAIDGMGCAMACGSKISTALAGLDGVVNTDINFIGAGEANSAIVEFDAAQVSEKEMINIVNNLSGGHYEVKNVEIIHYAPASAGQMDADSEKKEKMSSFPPSELDYKLPNIFSVFTRLF